MPEVTPNTLGVSDRLDKRPMNVERRKPLLTAAVLSLLVFLGTYCWYLFAARVHAPGSYVPFAVGLSLFVGLMLWANYRVLTARHPGLRLGIATVLAIVEGAVFAFVFMFVVLSTLGS